MEYKNPNLEVGQKIEILESKKGIIPTGIATVKSQRIHQWFDREILSIEASDGRTYQMKSTATRDVLVRPFCQESSTDFVAFIRA